MSKIEMKKIANNVKKGLSKHSTKILTGLGIAGMCTTVVISVKATPKAIELIENKKKEEGVDGLSPFETVKTAYKPYIPAIVLGIASTACLIGANSVSSKKTAALAAAYEITKTTFSDYKDRVVETIGEEKSKAIKEQMAHDKNDTQPAPMTQVVLTDTNIVHCIDNTSGQEIDINFNKIKEVENKLNSDLLSDDYVSLNTYYEYLGLTTTSLGELLGWYINNGKLEIVTWPATNSKGLPCLILDFNINPEYDYYKTCK